MGTIYYLMTEYGTYGVLFVTMFIVWRIWRHLQRNFEHLEEEDFNDMLSNRMSKIELTRAREHLLRCEACKARFDEMTKIKQKLPPERMMKRRF